MKVTSQKRTVSLILTTLFVLTGVKTARSLNRNTYIKAGIPIFMKQKGSLPAASSKYVHLNSSADVPTIRKSEGR